MKLKFEKLPIDLKRTTLHRLPHKIPVDNVFERFPIPGYNKTHVLKKKNKSKKRKKKLFNNNEKTIRDDVGCLTSDSNKKIEQK